jgi:lysophospholipase L1-like esterase
MPRNLTPDYRPVPGRFRDIKTLCAQNGVRLLFVVPPTRQESDTLGTRIVLEAAESVAVPASIPVPNAQLSDDKYADGYHLNSAGQKIFTAALAEFLRKQAGHDL